MTLALRLLGRLHHRGFHAAVLAAVIVMPTVAATGFLTRGADRDPAGTEEMRLRPSLVEGQASAAR